MGMLRQGMQGGMDKMKQGYQRMADPRLGMQAGPAYGPQEMGGDKTMPGIPPMHGVGPNAVVPPEAPGMTQGRKMGFLLRSLLPGGMRPGEAGQMVRQPQLPQQPRPVQDIQGFKWSRGTMGANRSY